MKEVAGALSRRQTEGLKIFRPLPHQERAFMSRASELLLRGGNRSGKTACAAALVASAATGMPIIGCDGQPLPWRWPQNRPLCIWVIGYGEKHIADPLWGKLFTSAPELSMLRDENTGQWRAFNPLSEADKKRKDRNEVVPAPPLIPKRYIKRIAWHSKAARHFTRVVLKPQPGFPGYPDSDGTEIFAFTSLAEAKQGVACDLIWVDEAIRFPKHYAEWQARISDRKGRIVWSVYPGHVNFALIDLIKRCEQQRGSEIPDCEEVRMTFSANPYIDSEEKAKRFRGWSEDERRRRDEGELVSGDYLVWPNFTPSIHCTPAEDEAFDDDIDKLLRSTKAIPRDWCCDLILDPGHTHPGVLFCAIPPPKLGVAGVIFDEVYLPNSDATQLAKAVEHKARSHHFRRFIIDFAAGRMTPMGSTQNIQQVYADAFAKVGLQSEVTGSNFMWSSDDLDAGLALVREKMIVPYPSRRPWLRVMTDRCPNFLLMLETYVKATDDKGFITEKPAKRQVDCLCDCLRYWVATNPEYEAPNLEEKPSSSYTWFKNFWQRQHPKPGEGPIYCGPGVAPRS